LLLRLDPTTQATTKVMPQTGRKGTGWPRVPRQSMRIQARKALGRVARRHPPDMRPVVLAAFDFDMVVSFRLRMEITRRA
jgi:hypothetical protein